MTKQDLTLASSYAIAFVAFWGYVLPNMLGLI